MTSKYRQYTFPGFDGILTAPAGLEMSRTGVSGEDYMAKYGHNNNVGVNPEPVWAASSVAIAYPTPAQSVTLSSADANDTSAGTGARTVFVEGLNGSYVKVTETVTLNGQTGVSLTNTYLRIYRMYTLTAGSGGANAGVIYAGYGTVTGGVPANVMAVIGVGDNQTLQAAYTIPAGKTGFLTDWGAQTNKSIEARIRTREVGGVWRVRRLTSILDHHEEKLFFPIKLAEKTDVEILVDSAVAGADVSATFDIILI